MFLSFVCSLDAVTFSRRLTSSEILVFKTVPHCSCGEVKCFGLRLYLFWNLLEAACRLLFPSLSW